MAGGTDAVEMNTYDKEYSSADVTETGSPPRSPRASVVETQTRIRRLFSFAQIFSFSLTFMSTWEGMNTNMYFALYNGGPRAFFWSILIVYCGALAQAASLAEMASIQPIAGAQYHWTHQLAPQSSRRFVTWIQGWVTWFGWISLLAGVSNITAIMLQALASLNHPEYVAERWHITLIMFALVISQGLMNMYVFWLIPWCELVAGILHVCLFVVFVVVMTVMGTRHSAEWVFTHESITSGWSNSFVSFNLGMLTGVWSFTGFDGAVHMGEETRKAKNAVPQALFWSIALNGVLALGMVVTILFAMGPLDTVLASSFPIIDILQGVTGSTAATTAMVSGLFAISFSVCLASIASVSRLTWAWARDGGLPRYFAYVSPRHLVPIRAVWLSVIIVMILALINIGSSVAFGVITALSSLALYFSYTIAIGCLLYARAKDPDFQAGSWNLGRFGPAVNIFALCYTIWAMFWLPWPLTLPVDGTDMNYAGPIFGAVIIFALSLWFLRARKHWEGPNVAIIDFVLAASK